MLVRLIVLTLVWFGVLGLILFLAAGTVAWPAAWVFIAQGVTVSLVGGAWLARLDPDLVQERLRFPVQNDQPTADKVLVGVLLPAMLGALVLMALDAVRFGWSRVPVWTEVLGVPIIAFSLWISFRVLRENSFAATAVKIQTERGQTVIATGPYQFVRHPMYSGAVLYFVGTSLLLGSLLGLVAASALAVLFGIRLGIEEAALRAGLQGYDDYAERVRYRLIPRVW